MKTIFTILLLILVNLGTPILSKDISLKKNGNLKDECRYLTDLIERIILAAYTSKPSDEQMTRELNKKYFLSGEFKNLEILNPNKTSVLKVYLDLCK